MIRPFFLTFLAAGTMLAAAAQQRMSWDEAYGKADSLLVRLTTDEKIAMMRGYSDFFFKGHPEKGIPYIYLSDATQGVNMRNNLADPTMVRQLERSVAFPAPILLSSTFNPELVYRYAQSVGEECRAGGIEILLGPGLNIYRQAQCGRSFEYFGEDPWWVSRVVEQYVRGMQSTGTAACLKHFVVNNTEFYRRRANSIVDERTLHEIYLPGFKAGIDAGVAAVMTSYNLLNGEWTGQSRYVIHDLLRGELGFRGLVMTDWHSIYDWEQAIKSGLSVEMGGVWDLGVTARELLDRGRISEADIDRMLRSMVAACIAFDLYDREKYCPELLDRFPEHEAVAYRTACEGVVLLKNDGLLPLGDMQGRTILLTGKFIDEIPRGQGSAAVRGYDNISLRQALISQFGGAVHVVEHPTEEELRAADVVIFSAGTLDSEAVERPFNLPVDEERAICRAVEVNPHTIVLMTTGSGTRMSHFADKAAAILYGWYPGQNGFKAIAGILAGSINPSGKLPISIEREFSDSPAYGYLPPYAEFYRDSPRNERSLMRVYDIKYSEGVLVGYRWYDTKGIEPLYPFGYGLSYTSFQLSHARLSSDRIDADGMVKVTVTLTNTGEREGAEVVQLYVGERSPRVMRPVKELKGVNKVLLAPGESRSVVFEIGYRDLAYWDVQSHGWRVDPGKFDILIGTSSRDIVQRLELTAR